jgi:hypothetical protein
MRYFTPERYARLQQIDESTFAVAFGDWERAVAQYRADLAGIAPGLPAKLRRFATAECLHDAVLLADWMDGDQLQLLLRSGIPGEALVLLGYSLLESPSIERSTFPAEYHTPHLGWLYDEVGVEADGAFSHAILFSNGDEVRLRFSDFDYSRLFPILSARASPP